MVIPMHNAQCWEKISSGQRTQITIHLWRHCPTGATNPLLSRHQTTWWWGVESCEGLHRNPDIGGWRKMRGGHSWQRERIWSWNCTTSLRAPRRKNCILLQNRTIWILPICSWKCSKASICRCNQLRFCKCYQNFIQLKSLFNSLVIPRIITWVSLQIMLLQMNLKITP